MMEGGKTWRNVGKEGSFGGKEGEREGNVEIVKEGEKRERE